MRVAGLAPVHVPTIENVNVTEFVPGHMAYRAAMPKLLREVGWLVESDEFVEIEDPDPENHEIRQRELINEIEEARKELEKKAQEKEKKGGKLSWWKKKKADKKEWEVYDEQSSALPPHRLLDQDQDPAKLAETQIMFDIDAIRKEVAALAAESKEYNAEAEFEIKEIKSTLPPMKIDMASVPPAQITASPYSTLRETKSYNDSLGDSHKANGSTAHKPGLTTMGGAFEEYDEFDDPGAGTMEMTFDTSFRDDKNDTLKHNPPSIALPPSAAASSRPRSPLPLSPLPSQPSRSGATSPWGGPPLSSRAASPRWDPESTAAAPSWDDEPLDRRPHLRSGKTEPAEMLGGDLGANAWADEFDEDFGEKEVKMSFM